MTDPKHPMRRTVARSAVSSPRKPGTASTRRRKRDRARELLQRMQERRRRRRTLRRERIAKGLRTPQKRKKVALALGASAMSFNTAAISASAIALSNTASAQEYVMQDPTQVRVSASKISASDDMKLALIEEEGIHRTVYADPVGLLTVGVGHLVAPEDNLRLGQHISDDRIIELLEQDLEIAEQAVQRLVGDLTLYQHEFDALVDLVFNVGEGNVSPERSPRLNQAIADRNYEGIAEQLAYHNAAGERLKGLQFRSDRREAIFMEARYDNPREAAASRT
ncbi:lysozyme [Altererythrobacter sp. MF3-039]|uniref:lysozyme n=1 Tax=Altererythrobacter sp. MF3-039 TaxID=3252901 RepID=UPI00390C9B0A